MNDSTTAWTRARSFLPAALVLAAGAAQPAVAELKITLHFVPAGQNWPDGNGQAKQPSRAANTYPLPAAGGVRGDAADIANLNEMLKRCMTHACDTWSNAYLDDHTLEIHYGWEDLNAIYPLGSPLAVGGAFMRDAKNRTLKAMVKFNNDMVLIPGNAALDWYIDPTAPYSPATAHGNKEFAQNATFDTEDIRVLTGGTFTIDVGRTRAANNASPELANNRFDLVTVAFHEVGHCLGLQDGNPRYVPVAIPPMFQSVQLARARPHRMAASNTGIIKAKNPPIPPGVGEGGLHLEYPKAVMSGTGLPKGERHYISAADVLALAEINDWIEPNYNPQGGLPVIAGPIITGKVSRSGANAPNDGYWSEVSNSGGGPPNQANTDDGYSANSRMGHRLADDFTVTEQRWHVTGLGMFVYQPNSGINGLPFDRITVRIWRGRPGAPGSTVTYGDAVTDRWAEAAFINTYRILNSENLACGAAAPAPNDNRPIYYIRATLDIELGQGTYWVDWDIRGDAALAGPLCPTVTVPGNRQPTVDANAMKFDGMNWAEISDAGIGCNPPAVRVAFPMRIYGTRWPDPANLICRANCDGSTSQPILNVIDFACFINQFAAGDTRANCDESTFPPILNVNDFACFLNAFGAGCPTQ